MNKINRILLSTFTKSSFFLREGSTERVKACRDRFLSSPLICDVEYISKYREAYEATPMTSEYLHRAECHSYALENMTPVIRDGELIVGSKTRYVRGGQLYLNCASNFVTREIEKLIAEESSVNEDEKMYEVGDGFGFLLEENEEFDPEDFVKFGGKFNLRKDEIGELHELALFFKDKCMQAVGDSIWKNHFPDADFIEKGWESILYTHAHDPAPDGRMILDFRTGLGKGFRKMIDEINERINEHAKENLLANDEKILYWKACIRVLEAAINFSKNYSKKALEMMNEEGVSAERKEELKEIARICEKCPEYPPESFHEAVQAFWMIYVIGHLESAYLGYSVGRFDQYMYPYFDIDGRDDLSFSVELLEMLRVKMQELEYIASFSWEGLGSGNLFQNMILGGEDEYGQAADNDLSLLCIDAALNCQTTEPSLSVFYTEGLSQRFLLKAAELVKTGCGFPAWFNLKTYLQHELEKTNLPLKEIRKYSAVGGCTEPTLEGCAYGIVQPGFINHQKVFEIGLFGGKDPITGNTFIEDMKIPETYEELEENYLKALKESIRIWQAYWNLVMIGHKKVMNNIFASTLTNDCIKKGLSLDDGGARVNCSITTLSSGMVNAANSLSAVKNILSNHGKNYSMEDIRKSCLENFEHSQELKRIGEESPKWGNDDEFVDDIFVNIYHKYCDFVELGKNFLGEPYDPSALAISTHIPFGKACIASPDGRMENEPLADGVTSPYPSTDKNGVFSVLRSCQKVDHRRIRGGLLNIKFHPISLKGVEGSKNLIKLIENYFSCSNPFQIQFNVVDVETLKDAQKNPSKYRDLIVRVAGFSANFIELSKSIQDEIIARTEHFLGGSSSIDGDELMKNFNAEIDIDSNVKGTVFDVQDFSVHDGEGVRLTVFFKGCPLSCFWCHNPESISAQPEIFIDQEICKQNCLKDEISPICEGEIVQLKKEGENMIRIPNTKETEEKDCPFGGIRTIGEEVSTKELFDQIKGKIRFIEGITFSGGEPMYHKEFLLSLIRNYLLSFNLDLGIETSGFFEMDEIAKEIFHHMNVIFFDIKALDAENHEIMTGRGNKRILENLRSIAEDHAEKIILSIPLVNGFNSSEEEFEGVLKIMEETGISKARILPLHGMAASKYLGLGINDYKIDGNNGPIYQDIIERNIEVGRKRGLEIWTE